MKLNILNCYNCNNTNKGNNKYCIGTPHRIKWPQYTQIKSHVHAAVAWSEKRYEITSDAGWITWQCKLLLGNGVACRTNTHTNTCM